jgi:hypothetical protein
MAVPARFVLDAEQCAGAGLPAHVSEFRLGQTVDHIRHLGHFVEGRPENRRALDAVGFIWDSVQYRFEAVVLPALEWYHAAHRDSMDVPARFVLDEEQCADAGLPAHVRELRLGHTVQNTQLCDTC